MKMSQEAYDALEDLQRVLLEAQDRALSAWSEESADRYDLGVAHGLHRATDRLGDLIADAEIEEE